MTDAPSDVLAGIRRDLARHDVLPADAGALAEAWRLARGLIGDGIADLAALEAVHARSGAGVFVALEAGQVAGVLAFVPLNAAGRAAVTEDRFDALQPDAAHVAGPGQPVEALYGWGVAAASKTAAKRLLEGARDVGQNACADLPHYARPTTEAGHRLMRERLGFVDAPGSRTGLVWIAPFRERAEASPVAA